MTLPSSSLGGDVVHEASSPSGVGRSHSDIFRATVTRYLRKNINNETYVPQGALSGTLSQEVVKHILLETSLDRSQVDELSRSLLPGAVKVFTILLLVGRLECILSFIEDDQMQPNALDQKLPLSLQTLLTLLDDEVAAAQFYRQQWTFTAPVFNRSSLPRILEKKTIMPFMDSKPAGEGGFGEVHQVVIDPSHHSFAHPGHHQVGLSRIYLGESVFDNIETVHPQGIKSSSRDQTRL
jgi:hypothetical protein